MQRALLDLKPQIIHFSGHGEGKAETQQYSSFDVEEGLYLEDEKGEAKLISTDALAALFRLFANSVECVILNACYSEAQAKAITQHIPYAIGMKKAIGDRAAIEFAIAFYDALGAGESIEFAYKLGCIAIQMEGIPEHLTPILKSK
ncbi:MAG: CHAT domain-containing protein [Lyngbya sp.]|nr:CHAT domain-containing protein [Lyngbya sp.]